LLHDAGPDRGLVRSHLTSSFGHGLANRTGENPNGAGRRLVSETLEQIEPVKSHAVISRMAEIKLD
jgi:hypothetical protein